MIMKIEVLIRMPVRMLLIWFVLDCLIEFVEAYWKFSSVGVS